MNQFGWRYCPPEIYQQVRALLHGTQERLGASFVGLYLHGSLALNCFNPYHSDIDLLLVSEAAPEPDTLRTLVHLLLTLSGAPMPLEVSLLARGQLWPWRYPPPCQFHYGESHRATLQAQLDAGRAPLRPFINPTDPDLAAHITVLRRRGLCIFGEPIEQLFPEVPTADFLHAVTADFRWALARIAVDPTYFVLNACRLLAFLLEGRLLSKDEGAVWALQRLPNEELDPVYAALTAYRGTHAARDLGGDSLQCFAHKMADRIEGLASSACCA